MKEWRLGIDGVKSGWDSSEGSREGRSGNVIKKSRTQKHL